MTPEQLVALLMVVADMRLQISVQSAELAAQAAELTKMREQIAATPVPPPQA